MADQSGWCPPGQICYPPELPAYLKNVNNLQPVVGVPSDNDVIAIHTVIHAANGLRVSGVPGMHDPGLFVKLADHLFGVQMARYQNRYSRIMFPSDATYTPPALPAHISVDLESVSGTPSDDEIMKSHQCLMRVNMELSQHLFDLQAARYTRNAGGSQPNSTPQVAVAPGDPTQSAEQATNTTYESINDTNNIGIGANAIDVRQPPQLAPSVDIRDLMERSNQLAERFNQLLERSNVLMERGSRTPTEQASSQTLADRFGQVLGRLAELVEQSHQSSEQSNRFTERFNQLFERFHQLVDRSNQTTQTANQLAERSNQLTERSNQSFERSNQISSQTNQAVERLGDSMKNINRVLVGIQHAIVRNHRGNTVSAINCLVNEKGDFPGLMHRDWRSTVNQVTRCGVDVPKPKGCSVEIDGTPQRFNIPDNWVGDFLRFYGVCDWLRVNPGSPLVIHEKKDEARGRLGDYLSSCLG